MSSPPSRYGFLFPGQGAQVVGMGKDLYERFPEARELYDRAEEILKLPIKEVSFYGPEPELRRTSFTQPAIFVNSLACLEIVRSFGIEPGCVAGHSLGEYSALCAARALEFSKAIELVRLRGELMEEAGREHPGAMAAIIGLDLAQVSRICAEVKGVWVANLNAPDQVVISGEPEGVEKASDMAKEMGAHRAIPLPVSGAFHSPLMEEAARRFEEVLEGVEFQDPRVGVIVNATGELVTEAQGLKEALMVQLRSPVQWVKTVETAQRLGFERFLELGPGRVLTGLLRRIDPGLSTTPLGRAEEFQAFRESLQGGLGPG